jgi:hypothetical protein
MRTPLVFAALVLAAAPAAAQRGASLPIELGVDAGVSRDDRADVTTFAFPISRVRAGFFLSPALSLEPTLGVMRMSGDGASATQSVGALGLVAHLAGVPTGRARTASFFVRPFVGFERASVDFDENDGLFDDATTSATQAFAGAGAGFKLPVGDRLAWRIEGVFTRLLESDDRPAGSAFGLNVGLSFHAR